MKHSPWNDDTNIQQTIFIFNITLAFLVACYTLLPSVAIRLIRGSYKPFGIGSDVFATQFGLLIKLFIWLVPGLLSYCVTLHIVTKLFFFTQVGGLVICKLPRKERDLCYLEKPTKHC